jgi:hypothetical protein
MLNLPEPILVDQEMVKLEVDDYTQATTVEGSCILFGLQQSKKNA